MCVQRAGAKEEGRKESEVTLPEGTVVLRLECRRLPRAWRGWSFVEVCRWEVLGEYEVARPRKPTRSVFFSGIVA